MSLTSIMEIGRSGLSTYQSATEVTSENIANVNTPGYSRQRVILETSPPATNGGTGVYISKVERYYDGLLQQQLVTAQSTQGNDTTKSNVLQQIEPTFNEVANDGLGAAISNFFGSWQDLTLNPAGSAERQSVMTRAQILVDNFHSVSTTLNNTITAQDNSLVPLTADISEKIKNIAQLNGQIKITQQVGGNANVLKDQRDLLIRELSTKVGVVTSEPNPADGTVNVNLTTSASGGGQALVTGDKYATMYADNVTVGAPSLPLNDIYLTAVGNPPAATNTAVDARITATVGGPNNVANPADNSLGEIGATLALRDTIIPGYLAKVDELANQMVTKVNALHSAGYTLANTTGVNFFTPAGTTAATIGLNIASTDLIAAGTAGPPVLPGDNANALAIAQLQSAPNAFVSGTATFNSYFDSLTSKVGLDVQSSKNTVAQDVAFTNQLNTLRESNSGVSLDEELTNLVKYQRSYQASAKLISTTTEMMDTVIGLIR